MRVRECRLVDEIPLHGGRLCLDFANTVAFRHDPSRSDALLSPAHLFRWAGRVGVLGDRDQAPVLQLAGKHARKAAAAFGEALTLRETIYRLFSALAHGGAPAPDDLQRLGMAGSEAVSRGRLEPLHDRFRWTWDGVIELERPAWEVAHDAIQLLQSPGLERVKKCPNHGCGWLFYDRSKNVSRRWCSMRTCGSAVKSSRQWERRKAAANDV